MSKNPAPTPEQILRAISDERAQSAYALLGLKIEDAKKRGDYDPARGFRIPPISPDAPRPPWTTEGNEDIPLPSIDWMALVIAPFKC